MVRSRPGAIRDVYPKRCVDTSLTALFLFAASMGRVGWERSEKLAGLKKFDSEWWGKEEFAAPIPNS